MTNRTGNAVCLPRNPDASRKKAPRLVLGVTGPGGPAEAAFALHKLGWEITTAATGADARRLACKSRSAAVILPVDGVDESGLLTCAKLARANSKVRVVLVGPDDEEMERFALFAGAMAYVPVGSPVEMLVRAVTG
jgi:DNA-binding response OmpR family regulator